MVYGEGTRVVEDDWTYGVFGGDEAANYIRKHATDLWRLTSESVYRSLLGLAEVDAAPIQRDQVLDITDAITYRGDTSGSYFGEILANPRYAIDQGRLNPATYENQRLVVAWKGFDEDEIGAFCLSENVTSGRLQGWKQRMDPAWPIFGEHQFAQQRLLAVRYALRASGVAEAVGYKSIQQLDPRHNVTAYTWPDLFPRVDSRLLKLSFERERVRRGQKVGPVEVDFYRYLQRAGNIRETLRESIPGFDDAMLRTDARDRTKYYGISGKWVYNST